MKIRYKIIEVYPSEHSIVVRFYTDLVTEKMLAVQVNETTGQILRGRTDYNINLPIPAPSGDALDALIVSKAPAEFLALQESVLNPAIDTSLSDISNLLGKEKVATVPNPLDPAEANASQQDIPATVAMAKVRL